MAAHDQSPTHRRALPLIIAALLAFGCDGAQKAKPVAADEPADWFIDRAADAGLDFTYFNGMSGAAYYAEHMGAGVALLDYDNDGDVDVFVVQGQMLGAGKTLKDALFPPKDGKPIGGRLYRNDLETRPDGSHLPHFTDVTTASGIHANGYGMGAAAGDFNNDGCVDLYVTTLGRNQLFRNNCDGTFADVSKAGGVDDTGWSSSAAFLDYDRDGWLDLFVGHYLNYSTDANANCYSVTGRLDYCPPQMYSAQPSHLYHNNRDGTFADVTAAAGLAREFGPTLGVSTADFNRDGWIDIYVANDEQQNQLWINQHDGTFKNTGLLSGTALSAEGEAKSSMGVDAGDVDNDGDDDLFVTELTGQGADLFVNDGSGLFTDRSAASRLRVATLPSTGFGTAWIDADNDGWLDLLTVNGAVTAIEELVRRHDPFPLHQRKQLLRNLGNGRFEDVSAQAGAVFQVSSTGRGAAFGDIDNDGDTDVVVASNNGPVQLLVNQIGQRQHWIGLRLVGEVAADSAKASAGRQVRDLLGARVSVTSGGRTLWRRARSDGSYASANDPRVLVGLGSLASVSEVRVIWPDGRTETFGALPIDRYATVKEGTGR